MGTPVLIEAPNSFKKDLGELSSTQREQIVVVLRKFMTEAGAILAQSNKIVHDHCPKEQRSPCKSCAFSRRTESWPGFAETSYGLMKTFLGGPIFMCHKNQDAASQAADLIDPQKLDVCNGFLLVMAFHRKKAKKVAVKAAKAIKKIVGTPQERKTDPYRAVRQFERHFSPTFQA